MQKIAFALLALALVLVAVSARSVPLRSETETISIFQKFVQDFKKEYKNDVEKTERYMIFKEQVAKVDAHNARKDVTYTLAINKFSDLTWEEFRAQYLGYRSTGVARSSGSAQIHQLSGVSAPASVDWRTKGVVNPVKDQGQCGSCWSFSAAGSLESAHAIATGNLVSLSEQNLVDCSWNWGNLGCNGGDVHAAYQYIIDNNGLDTEKSYPYTEKDSHTCKFNRANVGATMTGMVNITEGDESAMEDAVANAGPVSVGIDVESSFQSYSSGVYNGGDCKSDMDSLDHAVIVVGYNNAGSHPYWIVRNSWSDTWGIDGYIWMAKGKNLCGIATDAAYPLV
jgi:C1A family cysteine protease